MDKQRLEDLLDESGELILTLDGFEHPENGGPNLDVHPHHIELGDDELYVDNHTREYFVPYETVLLAHRHVD